MTLRKRVGTLNWERKHKIALCETLALQEEKTTDWRNESTINVILLFAHNDFNLTYDTRLFSFTSTFFCHLPLGSISLCAEQLFLAPCVCVAFCCLTGFVSMAEQYFCNKFLCKNLNGYCNKCYAIEHNVRNKPYQDKWMYY